MRVYNLLQAATQAAERPAVTEPQPVYKVALEEVAANYVGEADDNYTAQDVTEEKYTHMQANPQSMGCAPVQGEGEVIRKTLRLSFQKKWVQ